MFPLNTETVCNYSLIRTGHNSFVSTIQLLYSYSGCLFVDAMFIVCVVLGHTEPKVLKGGRVA